jgi:hypothetical protein
VCRIWGSHDGGYEEQSSGRGEPGEPLPGYTASHPRIYLHSYTPLIGLSQGWRTYCDVNTNVIMNKLRHIRSCYDSLQTLYSIILFRAK